MSNKIKKRPSSSLHKTPRQPDRSLQEALHLHQAGGFAEADAAYRTILASQPRHIDALNLLATLCQQQGDSPQAVSLLRKAIAWQPGRADLHSNLGSALRGCGEIEEAIKAFHQALTLQPGHFESQFNLGLSHIDLGAFTVAAGCFENILRARPGFIPAKQMLAQCLMAQGCLPEALTCLREIVRLDPHDHNAFCEIGDILQAQGQFTEAVTAYRQALALAPENAIAHNNLGNTLVKKGELHAALYEYQEAYRCDPDLAVASVNLSWTYKEHGQIKDDVACLRHYLARHPSDFKAHSDMLFSMNYDPDYSPAELLAAARAWWQQHAPAGQPLFTHPERQAGQPIRLGFVSPDFREHPVGTFLLPLFSAIAPHEATLHCYAEMSDQQMDRVSHALRGAASSWMSTAGLPAVEAASRIHQDRIDILFDLTGHSANNRLDIMALKPAPHQVSWLGYVNTTGLPVIDFRLTDIIADPPGMEAHYSESLLRLPDTFFCYDPPRDAPAIGPLPALANGRITFGSLNNPAKLSEEVIALWAKLLLQVPDSELILVGKPFADAFIRERYLGLFADHGVNPERLLPLSTLPMQEYLELYNRIDIALDPFPHNGHTITCHTLWMGVPVITLAGDRYATRMSASALTAIDLAELIAHTKEEYLAIAARLAADNNRLATLRHSLRERLLASAMCDTRRFARNFLAAMHTILNPPANEKATESLHFRR